MSNDIKKETFSLDNPLTLDGLKEISDYITKAHFEKMEERKAFFTRSPCLSKACQEMFDKAFLETAKKYLENVTSDNKS